MAQEHPTSNDHATMPQIKMKTIEWRMTSQTHYMYGHSKQAGARRPDGHEKARCDDLKLLHCLPLCSCSRTTPLLASQLPVQLQHLQVEPCFHLAYKRLPHDNRNNNARSFQGEINARSSCTERIRACRAFQFEGANIILPFNSGAGLNRLTNAQTEVGAHSRLADRETTTASSSDRKQSALAPFGEKDRMPRDSVIGDGRDLTMARLTL